MPAVKIICPGCKASYTLKTQNMDSVLSQIFRCPKCNFSTPFRNLIGAPIRSGSPLHTHIAGSPGDAPGGKTRVAASTGAVSLLVENPARSLSLPPGEYILGRDSADSTANIKISPDPYMSRQQARLSVRSTSAGITCILIPLSTSNSILVNNKPANTQGILLHNGDRIVMGMTNVTIKM